jgi:hypothetical protein
MENGKKEKIATMKNKIPAFMVLFMVFLLSLNRIFPIFAEGVLDRLNE